MEQKTPLSMKEMKAILDNTAITEMENVILPWRTDERAGVRKLIESCDKKILRYREELKRLDKMLEYERSYPQYTYICGIDE
ncbi:MAG: ribonuclease HII, partial [Lachnospiraceae bacterium]|nr:ribonuclease HII [Lachnospiraceae bacterium]